MAHLGRGGRQGHERRHGAGGSIVAGGGLPLCDESVTRDLDAPRESHGWKVEELCERAGNRSRSPVGRLDSREDQVAPKRPDRVSEDARGHESVGTPERVVLDEDGLVGAERERSPAGPRCLRRPHGNGGNGSTVLLDEPNRNLEPRLVRRSRPPAGLLAQEVVGADLGGVPAGFGTSLTSTTTSIRTARATAIRAALRGNAGARGWPRARRG